MQGCYSGTYLFIDGVSLERRKFFLLRSELFEFHTYRSLDGRLYHDVLPGDILPVHIDNSHRHDVHGLRPLQFCALKNRTRLATAVTQTRVLYPPYNFVHSVPW